MERLIRPTADELARAVASGIVDRLTAALQQRNEAHLCLTGGTIAAVVYRELAASSADVDWSRVHLWWGDERFVPSGDADRNDLAAQRSLGSSIWDATIRHPMPALPEGENADGPALDAAAAVYAGEVAGTRFDLCLLGVGPDGHIASLFPGHPGIAATEPAIAVRDSPKPPPERISLSLPVINSSAEVWLIVAGAEKAAAVADARLPDSTLPAAQASGALSTIWWLDEAAASA